MYFYYLLSVFLIFSSIHPAQQQQQQHEDVTTARTPTFEETLDDFLRQAQDKDGMDLQVSTCKLSSEKLVATAQAAAARVLHGVCNKDEIQDKFENMEVQLGDQMNVVKAMLLSLEEKIVEQDQELKRQYRRILSLVSGDKKSSLRSGSGSGSYRSSQSSSSSVSRDQDENNNSSSSLVADDDEPSSTSFKSGSVGPRSEEIRRYNSTVHIEGGRRVFSYYWILTGMSYKLNNWNLKRALRSSSFYMYAGGYRIYLRIIPRYTATAMYIHVGITKGDFDDNLAWPFTFNMRIQVLAQEETPPKRNRVPDLKSRIWNPRELCSGSNWRKPISGDNPECVGLGFPHDVIKSGDYIWNDRLIVKFTAYLD